jgi:hypothetical protein
VSVGFLRKILFHRVDYLCCHFSSVGNSLLARFKVLSAVTMEITVLWDVTPCSLVNNYQHFGAVCCIFLRRESERSMRRFPQNTAFYQTTWHFIAENSNLCSHRHEILESHKIALYSQVTYLDFSPQIGAFTHV